MNRSLLLTLILAVGSIHAAQVTTETFSTDLGGFTGSTTAVLARITSGGNPDAYMALRRDLGAQFFDMFAINTNAAYTGNYITDGIGGITVDLKFDTDNVSGAYFRVRQDASVNGWLLPLTTSFATGSWQSIQLAFNPNWDDTTARNNGWITDKDLSPNATDSPGFADTMASVGRFELRFTSTDASTLIGVDNVGLTGSAVPEPSSLATLATGIGAIALGLRRRRQR